MGKERFDYTYWEPLGIDELIILLKGLDIPWLLAGGYAIEEYVGRRLRGHGDIDILVKRDDQFKIQRHLSGWELFWATRPGLKRWEEGEWLAVGTQDIWCRTDKDDPWKLQIMLFDVEDGQWTYKRNNEIRLPLERIFRTSTNGINYLAPEVQLLYKAKIETIEKDQIDFEAVNPLLNRTARAWLYKCMQIQFPTGHEWINELEKYH